MNRDDVIKALKCCSGERDLCKECPVDKRLIDECVCGSFVMGQALQLIGSLEQVIFKLENRLKECENGYSQALALERAKVKEMTEEKEAAIEDLKHCMYYANPKRASTCNFCIHDCEVSQDGTQCKGKDNWIYCSPVWRGVVKSEGEK